MCGEMEKILVLFVLAWSAYSQDFAYPETEDQRRNVEVDKNTRNPLYVPGRCPENQLLYPGDQESDWTCDCSPGFIYFPEKNGCYAAFRQGPCQNGSILVLKETEVSPKCVENPCRIDGKVRYHSRCYELDKSGPPCKPASQGGGTFGVNTTTLQLDCLKGKSTYSLIDVPSKCPRGSMRDSNNVCRETF